MPSVGIGVGGAVGGVGNDTVRIGGSTYGWSSVYATIALVEFRGFTGLKFDEELEVALGYGAGQHYSPIERTAGKYAPKPLEMTVRSAAEERFNDILLGALAQQEDDDGCTISKAIVPITVETYETSLGTRILRAIDCKLIARGEEYKEAPDLIVVPCRFSVMRYVKEINGKKTTLWNAGETGPV